MKRRLTWDFLMVRYPAFMDALVKSIRRQFVVDVADRVRIVPWQQRPGSAAETAGWLGLANLFLEGWGEGRDLSALVSPSA